MSDSTTPPLDYLNERGTELVIAIVGALGIDNKRIIDALNNRFQRYDYNTSITRISNDVIPELIGKNIPNGKYKRAEFLINSGDQIREKYKNNAILALGSLRHIYKNRSIQADDDGVKVKLERKVCIISSLKRPEEVDCLRNVYPRGFYLIGVYSSPDRRKKSLEEDGGGMLPQQADSLIKRDELEEGDFGQQTRDTFHLSDFYIQDDGDDNAFKAQVNRIVDLIFGDPFQTPTFDEYAMFHAFSASLRSADLSRQVGAVISRHREILASGANDCPRPGGGLFWMDYDSERQEYCDEEGGRDYKFKEDMNAKVRKQLFEEVVKGIKDLAGKSNSNSSEEILSVLQGSGLKDITEYGRMVHAEMEAILFCARNSISCLDGVLYATTFPCHNCAKHIIAAGISEVVYVEPYPKSRTIEFYKETVKIGTGLKFRPFMGVGPRQFFNLFSMNLSAGGSIKRKEKNGKIHNFNPSSATPRVAILPYTYVHIESSITTAIEQSIKLEKQKEKQKYEKGSNIGKASKKSIRGSEGKK